MKRQPLFYTLKVWLWSATVSPLIAAALQFYHYRGDIQRVDSVMEYPIILVVEVLLTFFLWLLFWALTAIFSNLIANDNMYRLSASITGLIIAGALCWSMTDANTSSLGDLAFGVALANCLGIFAGCWYFDISRPAIPSPPLSIKTEKHEQTTK